MIIKHSPGLLLCGSTDLIGTVNHLVAGGGCVLLARRSSSANRQGVDFLLAIWLITTFVHSRLFIFISFIRHFELVSLLSSHIAGFLRFLTVIANHDWENESLIVDLNETLTGWYFHSTIILQFFITLFTKALAITAVTH